MDMAQDLLPLVGQEVVADVPGKQSAHVNITFPVLNVKMILANKIVANDYNPNRVATQEYELLIRSIELDGVTQPIVTFYDDKNDIYIIVDGFHRWRVLAEHFGCKEIPIVVINKNLRERMASTIRHNRARGKHQVDLQAELVKSLMNQGLSDSQIAIALGMTEEEILRLKQIVGAAKMLAAEEYSASYGRDDEPHMVD
jgi:ParB-like chromosome segregation protein Spo0J